MKKEAEYFYIILMYYKYIKCHFEIAISVKTIIIGDVFIVWGGEGTKFLFWIINMNQLLSLLEMILTLLFKLFTW